MIMHAEVKIGDSMIELADANPQFPPMPCTLLLRVDDPDTVYNRALEAGATVMQPIADAPYGSRGGTVLDVAGNRLHISKPIGAGLDIFKGFRSVTPHLYAQRPVDLIGFLQRAFGGEEVYRAEMPDGSIPHAQVRIGDSIVALAGGHGPYTPMPTTLHLYVPGHRFGIRASVASGRELDSAACRSALRRPQRGSDGPVRQPLVHRHAHSRRANVTQRPDARTVRFSTTTGGTLRRGPRASRGRGDSFSRRRRFRFVHKVRPMSSSPLSRQSRRNGSTVKE